MAELSVFLQLFTLVALIGSIAAMLGLKRSYEQRFDAIQEVIAKLQEILARVRTDPQNTLADEVGEELKALDSNIQQLRESRSGSPIERLVRRRPSLAPLEPRTPPFVDAENNAQRLTEREKSRYPIWCVKCKRLMNGAQILIQPGAENDRVILVRCGACLNVHDIGVVSASARPADTE